MKLKALLDPNDPVLEELAQRGITLDDNAEYILTKRNTSLNYLPVKQNEQSFYISVKDIIYIESFGHEVIIHTAEGIFNTKERLKQLEKILDGDRFLRISNSVIVSAADIKRIEASLLQKFILHLSNGDRVDVTRSYYYIFKDHFNI